MKTLKYILSVLFFCHVSLASNGSPSNSFVINYEGHQEYSYTGCKPCLGYYSESRNSASIVMYEENKNSYWVINIFGNNNGKPQVTFYVVDRNPDLPKELWGSYHPVYDVSDHFEYLDLELQPGGRIAGKIHPVKVRSTNQSKDAVFAGSFDLYLK